MADVRNLVKEKISDRKFTSEETEEISDIIAVGAIKFSILRAAIGGDIIFDAGSSVSFEGDSGPYLQYAYALSTAESMAHLNGAFNELIADPRYSHDHPDLIKHHAVVIRALKGLVRRYKINVDTIRNFNTRHVLSDLSYLNGKRKTRKHKKRSG